MSCSRAAQGRGAGSAHVYHCCQATVLGPVPAILSELAASAPPRSDPQRPPSPPPSSGPTGCCVEAAMGSPAHRLGPHFLVAERGAGQGGACSLQYLFCEVC